MTDILCNNQEGYFKQQEDKTMKRLFLITLIVMAFVLVGVLHGGYIHEDRIWDGSEECAYTGNFPEQTPEIIFDSTVFSPPLL
jgi:hypothetical protein